MSTLPSARIEGRTLPTKRLVVSLSRADGTIRELVLHVGDELLLRGEALSGEVWPTPQRARIIALYKTTSWIRVDVPDIERLAAAGIPLSDFFRWVVIPSETEPPRPNTVWERLRSDWLRVGGDET